jgi:hypothetical protein
VQEEKLRSDFGIPKELNPTIIVGFGFSAKEISGKRKNRVPLDELVYYEKYGSPKRAIGSAAASVNSLMIG